MPVTAAAGYVVVKPGDLRNVEQILEEADANQVLDKDTEAKTLRIEKAAEVLLAKST